VAFERILSRRQADPRRGAHPDPAPSDVVAPAAGHRAFERLSVDARWIEVDTTDGYRPDLGQVVAFVNGQDGYGGLSEPCSLTRKESRGRPARSRGEGSSPAKPASLGTARSQAQNGMFGA
jgi:hypothetical protein